MENTLIILQQIAIMFLLLAVGWTCAKIHLLTPHGTGQLSSIVLYVVNPMVIIDTFQAEFDASKFTNLGLVFLLSAVSYALMILIFHRILPNKPWENRGVERFAAIYGNCGFMGIPLVQSLFGADGVFYLTAFFAAFTLFNWTHGVLLMAGKVNRTETIKALCNPSLICTILGVLLYVLQLRLPEIPMTVIGDLSGMNTPLAMLVSGAAVAQTKLLDCFIHLRHYFISALRLLAAPAIALLLVAFIPMDPVAKTTLVILSGTPVASSTTLFAIRYRRDSQAAAQMFTLSTLLSAISLPVLTLVCGMVISYM